MKATEKQVKLAEEFASYIKGLTGGSDLDSPSILTDMDEEIQRLSEEYGFLHYEEYIISECLQSIYFLIKRINREPEQ